jgi:dTDP-4-dehydrorhamnose reductase
MTILVLGSSGQLATHLREFLPDAKYCGRETLNLSKPSHVQAAIESMNPGIIVNAAAYTSVDQAESEPLLAQRVNAEGVAATARAAAALDVPLIHVSTDYIFDGRKTGEYAEDDFPRPLSVYGMTKLAGEVAARALCRKAWILRTSWLFSEHGTNFVKTMLNLARTRDEIRVVGDQKGRPTYAHEVARVIAEIVCRPSVAERLPFGTYNAVGGPIVSRHEFASLIVQQAFERGLIARRASVRAIATADFPMPARRPANSALQPNRELERVVGTAMDWRIGLVAVLKTIARDGGRVGSDGPPH